MKVKAVFCPGKIRNMQTLKYLIAQFISIWFEFVRWSSFGTFWTVWIDFFQFSFLYCNFTRCKFQFLPDSFHMGNFVPPFFLSPRFPSPPSLTKYFHSSNIFFSSAGQIFPSFSSYILQIFTSFSFEGKIFSFSEYFSPFPSLFFFSSMVRIFSFSRYLFSSFSFSLARGRVRFWPGLPVIYVFLIFNFSEGP